MKALPAVLGGEAGGAGLGLLCGTCGLPRPGGWFPALRALAWLWLGGRRLGLGGLGRSHELGLGLHRRLALLLGGLGGRSLGPRGEEVHLGFIGVFLAHGRAVDFSSLTGVLELPQLPHHLGEVVAGVGVVGATQAWPALEVAVVRLCCGLAWTPAGDAQASVVSRWKHGHSARLFGLGAEPDDVPGVALLLAVMAAAVLSNGRANVRRQ